MSTLVKIQRKGQITLPSNLRSAVGVAEGDLVVASVLRGRIVLTPQVAIDRSKFPDTDGDYTRAQRRIIDARLEKADTDIKRGRLHGPFDTAEQMAASIEANIKKLRASKRKAKPGR